MKRSTGKITGEEFKVYLEYAKFMCVIESAKWKEYNLGEKLNCLKSNYSQTDQAIFFPSLRYTEIEKSSPSECSVHSLAAPGCL